MARDFFGGLVILAFAGLYYVGTFDIQRSTLADNVGAQGVPSAYAAVLAILALLLVLRSGYGWLTAGGATAPASGKTHKPQVPAGRAIGRMLGMLAIGVIYLLLIEWAGYALTIALMIGAVVLYQGGRATPATLITALCGAAFFWLLFVRVLQIPLPAGLWGGAI
ncbi:MAG: hypothetical protein GC186_15360 [Rhodobacteraceae bacterium]|nr:hypothetical protein [Paracoccaceae bacterium]